MLLASVVLTAATGCGAPTEQKPRTLRQSCSVVERTIKRALQPGSGYSNAKFVRELQDADDRGDEETKSALEPVIKGVKDGLARTGSWEEVLRPQLTAFVNRCHVVGSPAFR